MSQRAAATSKKMAPRQVATSSRDVKEMTLRGVAQSRRDVMMMMTPRDVAKGGRDVEEDGAAPWRAAPPRRHQEGDAAPGRDEQPRRQDKMTLRDVAQSRRDVLRKMTPRHVVM